MPEGIFLRPAPTLTTFLRPAPTLTVASFARPRTHIKRAARSRARNLGGVVSSRHRTKRAVSMMRSDLALLRFMSVSKET